MNRMKRVSALHGPKDKLSVAAARKRKRRKMRPKDAPVAEFVEKIVELGLKMTKEEEEAAIKAEEENFLSEDELLEHVLGSGDSVEEEETEETSVEVEEPTPEEEEVPDGDRLSGVLDPNSFFNPGMLPQDPPDFDPETHDAAKLREEILGESVEENEEEEEEDSVLESLDTDEEEKSKEEEEKETSKKRTYTRRKSSSSSTSRKRGSRKSKSSS